jgi:hypothetical protein
MNGAGAIEVEHRLTQPLPSCGEPSRLHSYNNNIEPTLWTVRKPPLTNCGS